MYLLMYVLALIMLLFSSIVHNSKESIHMQPLMLQIRMRNSVYSYNVTIVTTISVCTLNVIVGVSLWEIISNQL